MEGKGAFIKNVLLVMLMCSIFPLLSCEENSKPSYCELLGGTCGHFEDICPEGSFAWTGLGCPGEGEGMCCLPNPSCAAIDGYCVQWDIECNEGYGGSNPMDCPGERSDQCCVPLEPPVEE